MAKADTANDAAAETIAQALCAIETPEEARAFISDWLTCREVVELAQRFEVARLLNNGASYVYVSRKTGASSTTVSRVSKCLNGGTGGYRLVLDRTEKGQAEADAKAR